MDYIAFMAHLPLSKFDELEDKLKEYDIGSYIIGYENEPYEHYHFLVEMPVEQYYKYAKSMFIQKYKLRGQAKKGLKREYGKVKKIDHLEKMKAYTLKQNNFRTNMDDKEIIELQALAIENTSVETFRQKLMRELKEYCRPKMEEDHTYHSTPTECEIKRQIIKYHISQNVQKYKLTRSILNNMYVEYMMYHSGFSTDMKVKYVEDILL